MVEIHPGIRLHQRGYAAVHHLPAQRGDVRIHAARHQFVRETQSFAGGGEDALLLGPLQRGAHGFGVEPTEPDQQIERDVRAEHGGPAQHLGAFLVEARQALANEFAQRPAFAARTRQFDREQRVAAALAAWPVGVRARNPRSDQPPDFRFRQRFDGYFLHQAILVQLAQHLLGPGVVAQFAGADCDQPEHRPLAIHARDVVQGRGAGRVAPLEVVEHDDHGTLPGFLSDLVAERTQQAIAMLQVLVAENGSLVLRRMPSQRVDPQGKRAIRLGQVGAGLEQVRVRLPRVPGQRVEQGTLADAGLAA